MTQRKFRFSGLSKTDVFQTSMKTMPIQLWKVHEWTTSLESARKELLGK